MVKKSSKSDSLARSTNGILLPSCEIASNNLGFGLAMAKNADKFRDVNMSGSISLCKKDSDQLRMNMLE